MPEYRPTRKQHDHDEEWNCVETSYDQNKRERSYLQGNDNKPRTGASTWKNGDSVEQHFLICSRTDYQMTNHDRTECDKNNLSKSGFCIRKHITKHQIDGLLDKTFVCHWLKHCQSWPNCLHGYSQQLRCLMRFIQHSSLVVFTSLVLCLALLTDATAAAPNTVYSNYTVAIFAPLCEKDSDIFQSTSAKAVKGANQGLSQYQYKLVTELIDSCSDAQVMERIVKVMTNPQYNAVIGPASHPLCTSSAHLSNNWRKPLISWHCLNEALSKNDLFTHVARTLPSAEVSSKALATVLRHFQWKRVAVFYTREYPWVTVSKDIHYVLTKQGFTVTHFTELDVDFNETDASQHLSTIPSTTKGKFPFSPSTKGLEIL